MAIELFKLCKFCIFDGAYLLYAVLVLVVSLFAINRLPTASDHSRHTDNKLPPMPGGELPFPGRPPQTSVIANIFALLLNLVSFSAFLGIARFALQFIRTIFLMRDNPVPLRSFWRYLNFYYIVIVLPAAFMPPVAHAQRAPDFHLLAAVSLLICVNAIGDVISVRIILRVFNFIKPLEQSNVTAKKFTEQVIQEIRYYSYIILSGIYCSVVLIVILMISSILYGVQIGQIDFGLTQAFFIGAWDRILKFPELATAMYWFRGQPGPFGCAGIPGLFIYGLSTFIPIFILSIAAMIWLFLTPFRIAVNLPAATWPVVRVASAESAVFILCLVTGAAFGRFVSV